MDYRTVSSILLLVGVTAGAWQDPALTVTLRLTTNATTVHDVGTTVQYTCTAENLMSTSNIFWTQVRGTVVIDLDTKGNGGELVLTRTLKASDHGTTLVCNTQYFDLQTAGYPAYYVKAETAPVEVAGVATTAAPPAAYGASVTVSVNTTSNTHRVGDYIQVTCETHNVAYGVLEVRQAKGQLESVLHNSWQPSRVLTLKLSAADHGTELFCITWVYWNLGSFSIFSERIPVNIQ